MSRKKQTTLSEYQQLGLLTKLVVKISSLLFNEMSQRFPQNSKEFQACEKMQKAINNYQDVMDNKVCSLPIQDNEIVIKIFYGTGIIPSWNLEEAYNKILTMIDKQEE